MKLTLNLYHVQKLTQWTSLVVLWLRMPANGGDGSLVRRWVRSLVQEDPTCCGAAKPVCHNY